MADIGIRRPVEFEDVIGRLKKWSIIERFTEIVVIAAHAGFHFDRRGDGPFHLPVEWQYFSDAEKHSMYLLAVAHTMRVGALNPKIIAADSLPEMFVALEGYVHGGLLEMRDRGVFSQPEPSAYGQGLTGFVRAALSERAAEQEIRVADLLNDLAALS